MTSPESLSREAAVAAIIVDYWPHRMSGAAASSIDKYYLNQFKEGFAKQADLSVNGLKHRSHKTAEEHGFHEDVVPDVHYDIGKIMLMVEELAEAHGELRDGREPDYMYRKCKKCGYEQMEAAYQVRLNKDNGVQHLLPGSQGSLCDGDLKPEGVPSEIADVIIRALDYAAIRGIDIVKAINIKSTYNETRPYKHGRLF